MASEDRITVAGLREFRKALRDVEAGFGRQLRVVLNGAAGIVVTYAQSHIEVKSGRARASIKARSTERTATVAIGGARAPYTPWLDFGGEGRRKGRPTKRPFIKEGRYVYRGLRVHSDDITQTMTDGLIELGRSAGLEVTTDG